EDYAREAALPDEGEQRRLVPAVHPGKLGHDVGVQEKAVSRVARDAELLDEDRLRSRAKSRHHRGARRPELAKREIPLEADPRVQDHAGEDLEGEEGRCQAPLADGAEETGAATLGPTGS